jgi:1-acyl-sn-glycerol-3-phosphate acyltransferase
VLPGEVAPYRAGVAVLSKRTGVPVIPVILVNADKVLPVGQRFPSFGQTVYVLFGEPIDPDDFDSVTDPLGEIRSRRRCCDTTTSKNYPA